jgi:hypothetical protein
MCIRRGVFRNVEELVATIHASIEQHNNESKPIIWTAKASDILEKDETRTGGSPISAQQCKCAPEQVLGREGHLCCAGGLDNTSGHSVWRCLRRRCANPRLVPDTR